MVVLRAGLGSLRPGAGILAGSCRQAAFAQLFVSGPARLGRNFAVLVIGI